MRSRIDATRVIAALLCAALGAAPAAAERGAPGPAVEEVLNSATALTEPDVEALLDVSSHRSPGLRQQAVERLVASRSVADARVVARLARSGLATQLSCLEVLDRWGAPVAGIDPWHAETVTAALPRLEAWLARPRPVGPVTRPALEAEALERAFDDLVGSDDARASGALERLTAVGASLGPRLRQLAGRVTDDRVARRLAVLRYRLAMTRVLAAKSPTLPFELATTSGPSRAQLMEHALADSGAEARSLLLELVADAHPLVRETAVKLLRKQGGASDRLAALLSDPDPNVRAAVLKELASSPEEALAAELAKYVTQERDEDLLVHAARALAGMHGKVAVRATMTLLKDASWRVRAEAVESLKKRVENGSSSLGTEVAVEIATQVRALLSDPDRFVRAKAITVMQATNDPEALEPLLKIANSDISLAPAALAVIAGSAAMRKAATPALRKLCISPDPAVRAAAMRALGGATQLSIATELSALLGDAEREPRIAALEALVKVLGEVRAQKRALDSSKSAAPDPSLDALSAKVVPLLASTETAERRAALHAALFLGLHAEINPELIRAARKDRALLEPLARNLSLLDWRRRSFLLDILINGANDIARRSLVEGLLVHPPVEALPLLWSILDRGSSHLDLQTLAAKKIHELARSRQLPGGTAALVKHFDRAKSLRGTVALQAILEREPATGSALAREVVEDATAHPTVRANALRLLLAREAERGLTQLAMARIKAGDSWAQGPALGYLAAGASAKEVRELAYPGGKLESQSYFDANRAPPRLPPDLKPEHVRWHLITGGAEAAYSANLLAMMKESWGVAALVARYDVDPTDDEARLLLVDALVVLDRDEDAPILERVWKGLEKNEYALKQFRERLGLMSCAAAKALRRKIAKAGKPKADDDDLEL